MTVATPRADRLHGLTVQDIQGLARQAAWTDFSRSHYSMAERIDAALHAITVLLCTSEQRPRRNELLYTGQQASSRLIESEMRHHGIPADNPNREYGVVRQAFARFWSPLPSDPLEDRVVDRVSVRQIWDRLHPGQRDALLALATIGDYAVAADSLGLTYKNFCAQVRKGRSRFLEFWHEGESPSRPWGHDRRDGRPASGRTAMRNVRRRERAA